MLKTVDGKEIDPKKIDRTLLGGIKGDPAITGVIMKEWKRSVVETYS
jgi:hypothetical protein